MGKKLILKYKLLKYFYQIKQLGKLAYTDQHSAKVLNSFHSINLNYSTQLFYKNNNLNPTLNPLYLTTHKLTKL